MSEREWRAQMAARETHITSVEAAKRTVSHARAKAEIAIEKILSELESDTMHSISEVTVHTQDSVKFTVEICFCEPE